MCRIGLSSPFFVALDEFCAEDVSGVGVEEDKRRE
jgi:hypothetical protein